MESFQAAIDRPRLTWNTHTALAVIILGALVGLAVLRGSLASGGAVQP
jgi:hypothetical protein